jgi:hypothetical protein
LIIEWLNWQLKGEGGAAAESKFLRAGALAPFTEHMSKNWNKGAAAAAAASG